MKARQASYAGLLVLSAIDLLTVALVAGIFLFLVLSIDPPSNSATARLVKPKKIGEIVLQIASPKLVAEPSAGVEVLVKASASDPRYLLGIAPKVKVVQLASGNERLMDAVAILPKLGLPKKGWRVECEAGLRRVDLSVSPALDVEPDCFEASGPKCKQARIPVYRGGASEILSLKDSGALPLCLVSDGQKNPVACKEGKRTQFGNVIYRFEETDYQFEPTNPSSDVQLAHGAGSAICQDKIAMRVVDQ